MSKGASISLISGLCLLLLTGCNLPSKSFPATSTPIPPLITESLLPSPTITATNLPTQEPEAVTTQQVFLPIVEMPAQSPSAPTIAGLTPIAFLRQGDLFFTDFTQPEAQKLTQSGDVISFAWSHDGTELATFHGNKICFSAISSSTTRECLPVQLEGVQAQLERRMIWSPDGTVIVLWNAVNPWDENAIGWIVLPLADPASAAYIEDPIDWGAELAPNNEPGGITGMPTFIEEHRLIGTLTHRWLCGSGGCHYHLFEFDLEQRIFIPYPNKPDEGWSEGISITPGYAGKSLINFGTFYQGCEAYITFMDIFDLETESREIYTFEQEALSAIVPLLEGQKFILARSAGCSTENTQTWDETCGLTQGFDVYTLQVWDTAQGSRIDLQPGLHPTLSPGGKFVAFQSCLLQDASGVWQPSEEARLSIYIMSLTDYRIVHTFEGYMPAWQPVSAP